MNQNNATGEESYFGQVQKMLAERGEELGTASQNYSIEHGRPDKADNSLEAQAQRANHHLLRIAQADSINRLRQASYKDTISFAQGLIAEAEREIGKLDFEFYLATQPDRRLLDEWYETADQFTEPDRPREKTLRLGGGVLMEKKKTTPENIVLTDEDALAKIMPAFLEMRKHFRWGDAKKLLQVREGGRVVIAGDPENPKVESEKDVEVSLEAVSVTPRQTETTRFAIVNGHSIDLKGAGYDEQHGTATDLPEPGEGKPAGADHAEEPWNLPGAPAYESGDDPFGPLGQRPADPGNEGHTDRLFGSDD